MEIREDFPEEVEANGEDLLQWMKNQWLKRKFKGIGRSVHLEIKKKKGERGVERRTPKRLEAEGKGER